MSKSLLLAAVLTCAAAAAPAPRPSGSLTGDWDVYIALSAQPKFGFEGWRRMGFAHFAGADSGFVGFLRRRTGEPMLTVNQVTATGDSVLLTQDARVVMRAAWHGDTLAGLQFIGDRPLDRRFRLVRRASPGVVEHDYQVWTMPASDSQYAVTEDTLVFMPTRDGARLATYIARPVGDGPFGVVMQRTPYRRVLHGPGVWWASRGYIFIGQHVRGREQSSGDVA
ncbi:MAG TPA: CocE/NonD family hydrolase, partial [Gemmatimonadales bacterium]|nr:CocE/NonD family hydrolase [Gemmatimonadales bacterium]